MFFPILRYPSIIVFLPLEACLSDACYMYVIGFEITFQAVKFTFYTSEICHDIYVMVGFGEFVTFLTNGWLSLGGIFTLGRYADWCLVIMAVSVVNGYTG